MLTRTAEGERDDRRPLAVGVVLSLFFHAGILAVPLGTALLGTPSGLGNGGAVRVSIVEVPADGSAGTGGSVGSAIGTKPTPVQTVQKPTVKPVMAKPTATEVARETPPVKKTLPTVRSAKEVSQGKPSSSRDTGDVLTARTGTTPLAAAEGQNGPTENRPVAKPPAEQSQSQRENPPAIAGSEGPGGSGPGVGGTGTGGLPLGEGMLLGITTQVGLTKEASGLPAEARTMVFRVTVSPDGTVKSLNDIEVDVPRLATKSDAWAAAKVAADVRRWVFETVRFKPYSSAYIVEGRIIYNPDAKEERERAKVEWTSPIQPVAPAGNAAVKERGEVRG